MLPLNTPQITILICATEEYATKAFKSLSRQHTKPINTIPTKLKLIKKKFILINTDENFQNTRIKPYPPNFSKTPAKIIDPATGAST